jgi:hypothetical protein
MNRFGDFAALVIWDFHRPHRFIGNTSSASLPISLDEANRAGLIKLERSRRDDGSRRGDDMGQCLDAVVGGRWLTPRLRELPEDAARWSVRFLAFAGPHTMLRLLAGFYPGFNPTASIPN